MLQLKDCRYSTVTEMETESLVLFASFHLASTSPSPSRGHNNPAHFGKSAFYLFYPPASSALQLKMCLIDQAKNSSIKTKLVEAFLVQESQQKSQNLNRL